MRYISTVRVGEEELLTGFYELNPFPGNSSVVVSNMAFIHKSMRGKGFGQKQHEARLEMAKRLGYNYIICTVSKKNTAEVHILQKNNWTPLDNFYNDVTEHDVALYGKFIW